MSKIIHSISHIAFLAAACPTIAHASGDGGASESSVDDDSFIIVSALRVPVEQDRISSSVTVLDQADIEREQPIAISDILLRTPAISVTRNGGYGTATSLRIRGADSGQSVLVLDGMRLADATTTDGGYNFANLLADDITRIEILRGPQSILWGSNAIGGVINVQTSRAEKPLEGRFSVEAGSRDTVSARAGIAGKSDGFDWKIAGSTFTTDGISAKSSGIEPDGYTRQSLSGSFAVQLSPNISADVRGYWADASNDFDGFSGDSPEYGLTREWTAYAGLNAEFFDGKFKNRIAILEGRTDRENYDPRRDIRQLNFDANGRSRRYEYQGSFTISPLAEILFGAEREEQRMTNGSVANNDAPYTLTPSRADTDSFFGQMRVTPIEGVTISGGARHDRHSRFGGNTVLSTGAAWSLNGGATILRASYDEGFKAPSLYQLFSQYGAANLQPEKAKGWEVGLEQSFLDRQLQLSATWYERSTDNLIDFAFCPTTGALPSECFIPGTTTTRFGYYANVKKSRTHGLELSAKLNVGGAYVQSNYSIVIAEDRTEGSNFGGRLARVPRHLANSEIGYVFPFGLTASAAVRYSGKTLDRVGGTSFLKDYWLADLRAEWALGDKLTFYGRVENLFDDMHETAGGYGSLGRSFYLGLRSKF
ncbi:TonB-dependent receptor [uncultured Parasphingorhabdus sp.]|uniref:TonB-dependent receptor plug domain-containing protein n=1 Tax=uncultured Parasphingorhabdus sp. TaxID=2709694 RepID=UPI0030DBFDA2|tara:strand:+ start:5224 stop:7176 length:1953 start_codon:yes stop_codon:yes gene_type:complete